MLSNSRIYIFNIEYKSEIWLDILATNQLSSSIANILTAGIPDLKFKNIQFINVSRSNIYSSEIHINKLKYKGRRVIEKRDIAELRKDLIKQLAKINDFKFEQLLIVNDEFSREPSTGFMTEERFYV